MGVWRGVGMWGLPHAHAFKHDKYGCLHGGNHLKFLYMYILVLHTHMCVYVHVCGDMWGTPNTHPHPPPMSTHPQELGGSNY